MKGIEVLIITPSGRLRQAKVKSLEDMQAIVGGYIEGVGYESGRLYVDEEGLLKSKPYNPVASLIAHRPLVGNAFAVGMAKGPDDVSVSYEQVRTIKQIALKLGGVGA